MFQAATTLFAGHYEIEYQVDTIIGTIVMDRMHASVVDLEQLTFAHVDRFAADDEKDLIVGNDRQVDTMRVG